MISFISSFENFSSSMSDPKTFIGIAASVAGAGVADSNSIKTLLTNGFSTSFIESKPDFSNCPKSLSRNSPDYPILCNWISINFI